MLGRSRLGSRDVAAWQPWARRLSLAALVAGCLAYLPYRVFDGGGGERRELMREELERALSANRQLRAENAELRRDVAALKEDARAIEEIARDELGMVFPGEIVIRVERGEP